MLLSLKKSALLLGSFFPALGLSQTYVDLDFSNHVQATDGIYPNNSTLGPDYYSGSVFDFTNAGMFGSTSVDVRATMIGLTDGETSNLRPSSTYQFVGWIPEYNGSSTNNDLGVYYRHDGNSAQPTGGIAWTLSFFEGGGSFSTPLTLPGVRLLVYDHDGETYQSESIRTFGTDGFTGYQLHNNSGIHVHDEGGTYRFDSRGEGHGETVADGGMILYYQNTSSIRFDMFATTDPELPSANNGIFAAWDGDLGLTGGNTDNFTDFTAVPEPASVILLSLSGLAFSFRRDRRSSES